MTYAVFCLTTGIKNQNVIIGQFLQQHSFNNIVVNQLSNQIDNNIYLVISDDKLNQNQIKMKLNIFKKKKKKSGLVKLHKFLCFIDLHKIDKLEGVYSIGTCIYCNKQNMYF